MSKGLICRKIGMTQLYDKEGVLIPVTVLEAGPCVVTQVKTIEKDGYAALQLGFGAKKKPNKALAGHLKGIDPAPRYLKEFRVDKNEGIAIGSQIKADIFAAGETVKVSGRSIGKGTAGTVKRHKFGRGDMAHGSKLHRLPGSIGAGTTPGHVLKGLRMAGRMGNEKVSLKNVEIFSVDAEKNIILVKGAVPGHDQGIVSMVKHG